MKKISVSNYREDKYYPRIVRAVEAILATGQVVAPIDVFLHMDLLKAADLEDWRLGAFPIWRRSYAVIWRRRAEFSESFASMFMI